MLSPTFLPMRQDRHSAECSSNGKQALHFPRNPIENSIAKVLAIALEHEHANECEGSPVKNTSNPKFAHACAKSVLKFKLKGAGRANEEPVVRSCVNQEIPPRGFTKSCNLRSKWRGNKTSRFENTKLLV